MQGFLHQLLSGLANGGVYASVALALVMIYQATHLVNFAQGEMAMFSTYIAWAMLDAGFPYWAAFGLTLVVSFIAGVAIERIIIRPVERGPVLTIVIVFIGLLLILNSLAGWIFSYTIKSFPSPFPSNAWYGNKYMSSHEVGMIVVTLAVLILVFLFFRFTPLGLAMRAAAQNPLSGRLVGIRVGWMLAFGWGLAGAIGAVAGMMAAPIVYLDPNMMSGILLLATVLFALTVAVPAVATDTPGVTATEIKIGNTNPYSGPASAFSVVAKLETAFFKMVNDQGGVAGRKINFISLDDGYSPPKTLEQVRRLIEEDQVALLFNNLGTACNSAIQKYVNQKQVPHLFISSGADKWGDYQHFPWKMGFQPSFRTEAKIY